ncbi:hypothetical protein C5167_035902 [Papaver somniferum]|nr:hypothetical protein C5167_035902 [Papaver somniferum]
MPPSAKAFKLVGDVRTSLTSAREKSYCSVQKEDPAGLKLGEGEVELVVAMQECIMLSWLLQTFGVGSSHKKLMRMGFKDLMEPGNPQVSNKGDEIPQHGRQEYMDLPASLMMVNFAVESVGWLKDCVWLNGV